MRLFASALVCGGGGGAMLPIFSAARECAKRASLGGFLLQTMPKSLATALSRRITNPRVPALNTLRTHDASDPPILSESDPQSFGGPVYDTNRWMTSVATTSKGVRGRL